MTRSRQHAARDGQGWYQIQAQAEGPAQVYLYDIIGSFGVTAQDFLHELAAIRGAVEIHINSPGGDVGDGYTIYNMLSARPDVTTVVDGFADSAASVVLMAGEQRLMAPASQINIHDAWVNTAGNAAELQRMAKRLETTSAQIAEVYAMTAGGTAEYWRGLMHEETTFTPQQALEAGLITGITSSGRKAAAAAARTPAGAAIMASTAAATVAAHFGLTSEQVQAMDAAQVSALARDLLAAHGPQAASVDTSAWDGNAAMTRASNADDPAAAFRSICAGEHTYGSPSERQHWALPHHKEQGGPPNEAGVRNSLSRLPQTQQLADKQAAQRHLEAHMKAINPDYEPGESGPDTETGPGENNSAARASAGTGRMTMADHPDALTIEGRRTRITDISARLSEIAGAYPASVLPGDVQAEWDQLVAERRDHRSALESVEARNAVLAEDLAAGSGPAAGDRPRGADGQSRPQGGAAAAFRGAPAVHVHGDIYDLGAIRQQVHSADELPGLYRANALRAIERGRFPNKLISREDAQANVAKVLDQVTDDPNGILARRILATGSPDYSRAFGRALASGGPGALAGRDAQILALGLDDTGAYAVPFELDPTVILTSDGTQNPLRMISRVERIVGKEFDLVTSAGVTVTRGAERAVAPDATPTLAQPTIKAEKVQGFIKFSVELEGDWTALQASMSDLVRDAKDIEEGTTFTVGTGVAPDAGGVVATLPAGQQVAGTGATGAGINIANPTALESALPPRFMNNASFIANKAVFNAYRQLFAGQAGYAGDPWNAPSQGRPRELFGYPRYDVSDMTTDTVTAGGKVLQLGDFRRGFLIVDRVGMAMELVPHVMDATTQRPTGERGYYVWWRNNAVILVPNAFRQLVLP